MVQYGCAPCTRINSLYFSINFVFSPKVHRLTGIMYLQLFVLQKWPLASGLSHPTFPQAFETRIVVVIVDACDGFRKCILPRRSSFILLRSILCTLGPGPMIHALHCLCIRYMIYDVLYRLWFFFFDTLNINIVQYVGNRWIISLVCRWFTILDAHFESSVKSEVDPLMLLTLVMK